MKLDADAVLLHAKQSLGLGQYHMKRDGRVEPIAVVFGERDPKTGSEDGPGVVMLAPNKFRNGDDRELFAQRIRAMVDVTRAFAVFFMSEVWLVTTTTLDERANLPTDLKNDPRRSELVLATLEYAQWPATAVWTAAIKRDSSGKPDPLVFEQKSDGQTGLTVYDGRFTRWLPNRNLIYA